MPGVRLHHPVFRGVTVTVPHEGRQYVHPLLCPMCQAVHHVKTYHLQVDNGGDVVVSETVFERLREVDFMGFEVRGQVKDPEPIVLDLTGKQEPYMVVRHDVGVN